VILRRLGHLAARFAAVALLSGRPADYLAKHAVAPGVLGLYGLQEIRDGHVWVDPRLEAARPAVMAAKQDLRDCAAVGDSGAYREDKQYGVAIHTRWVADALAGRRPSMKHLGKSPNVTDWTSYSASWSGSCARPCAATRAKQFGGSSTSPKPAAWSWSSLIGRRDCRSSFGDYSPERCTRVVKELVVQPTFSLRTALAPSVP
jgi:hypothetical protein